MFGFTHEFKNISGSLAGIIVIGEVKNAAGAIGRMGDFMRKFEQMRSTVTVEP